MHILIFLLKLGAFALFDLSLFGLLHFIFFRSLYKFFTGESKKELSLES
jgi:hypothetical protein